MTDRILMELEDADRRTLMPSIFRVRNCKETSLEVRSMLISSRTVWDLLAHSDPAALKKLYL